MSSRLILGFVIAGLGVLASTGVAAATAGRPNIVIIVADDMGFADAGVYGCRDIPTPNLDALARDGVRFTNGYSSGCVCSPARAGLLTGRYQQRFGFDANAEGKSPQDRFPRALDLAQVTIAQRFKSLGYATGVIGKWHVGDLPEYRPTRRGFDEFYGILPFGLAAQGGAPDVFRGTDVVAKPANHMEQFCTEALGFIDRHRQRPFLLYLPFTAVHGPFVAPESWMKGLDASIPASRRRYAADLRQMDDAVGRILGRLRAHRLEENTLVFFFSDNGGPGGAASNGSLRGTKWTLWEGGIHVPFIVQWKGRIPGGRVLEEPVIQIDIMPTALAAAGAAVPADWKLDGTNLLPLLEGRGGELQRPALFWRFGVQYAVRQGDWKLLKPHRDRAPQLYNLRADIGEERDLAASEPTRVRQLQALWDDWNSRNEPPRWIDERWNGDGPRPKGKAKSTKAPPPRAKK